MAREDMRTPAPTDPADAVRAFYDSHPYPAPIGDLDRHRDLYRNPDRRRALFFLLWPTEKSQERVYTAIDGHRSIDEILRSAAGAVGNEQARRFIEQLWEYDQIVVDATGSL
jgi:hypothetical protein